jgi:hypothetical protein
MKSGLSNIALMNLGGTPYTWSRNASRNATVDAQSVPLGTFSNMYASDTGATATSFKVKSTQFYTLIGFKWWDGYEVSVDPVFVGYSTSQSADQVKPSISNLEVTDPDPETSIIISVAASDLGGSGLDRVELYNVDTEDTTEMDYNEGLDRFEVLISGTDQHYMLNYTIRAYDGAGNMQETTKQSYLFKDLLEPELTVSHQKTTVLGQEAVLIQAEVSDEGGSGIASVKLTYTIDSSDTTVDMVYNSTSTYYEYTITDQLPGTSVSYTVTVIDGDENSVESSEYSYDFYLDEFDPVIHSMTNTSLNVSGIPTVFIQANISDVGDSGIASVVLNYSIMTYNTTTGSQSYSEPKTVILDVNSTSGFYEYTIPTTDTENATAVRFSITVTDGHGNSVESSIKIVYFKTGPPFIDLPVITPSNPRSWDDVVVTVSISDDQGIKNATLYYKIDDGEWISISLSKNGNTYNATIPATPDGSTVYYYIEAFDTADQRSVRTPLDADYFSYIVMDDQENPVISAVLEIDISPMSSQPVVINATITDDIGIENATLYWRVDDGAWDSASMAREGDVFEATIPAQPHLSFITYYIEAFDTAGKRITSSEFNYTVSDDRAAPVIVSTSIDNPTPSFLQAVTITAIVEDDYDIENVTLYWKVGDSEWNTITMGHLEGNEYRATIPPQDQGVTITYFIRAFDTVGNHVDSNEQTYTVSGELVTTTTTPTTEPVEIGPFTINFALVFGVLIVVVLVLLFRRRR